MISRSYCFQLVSAFESSSALHADPTSRPTTLTRDLGGNDVQLTNLLNQCVFQWLVLRADTVAEAKVATYADKELGGRAGSIDWDAYGRGCDGQLLYTQSLIEGSHFSESLDNVLSAAKHKLADGSVE
jgi:hypothetical protein